MSRREFRYHFTDMNTAFPPHADDSWIRLSDRDFRNDPTRQADESGVDDEHIWAQDFWRIARAVYLADRRSARDSTDDNWTRTIRLSVQVYEPCRWKAQSDRLESLLELLTGDRWEILIHGGITSISITPNLVDHPPTSVVLFSGGLDSTAYAAYRAARLGDSERIRFVAFDTTVKKPQQSIFTSLTHLVPRQRSLRERMVLAPTRLLPTGNLDSTNRSRSLTYIAAAIRTAARENVSDVVVPENGQLAINPPLTPGRRAACSTRSVHPWIIGTVNRLIADVGGSVRVRNPLLSATKGEVCRCALDSGLAPETLLQTVSCGRPTTARWDSGRTYFNCGICFPCLVRRSGLHAALGGYDDSGYAHTLSSIDLTDMSEQGRKNASHLRDLIRWIDAPFTVDDLLADTPYPPTTSPQSVMPVLERGRGELGTMLTDLVPDLYPVRRPLLELHRR